MYRAASLFFQGCAGSLEKRWVKGVAVSPSARCPHVPPVVLWFGAGLTVSKGPLCSLIRAAGMEPLWPRNPYLAATLGARVDHTCVQLGQGDDGIAFA